MSTFKGVVDEFPDIRIDYFRAAPERRPPLACFLSHIHSDHLLGLVSLKSPFVYCSPATRELLLRLEKKFHRLNKEILECCTQDYKALKGILKTIPMDTPTKIELQPRKVIQVTLFDANHCSGAVMFLIEDERKAILYTGDIRSEPWWVNALVRDPAILPYSTHGPRCLNKIYLDTTFASKRVDCGRFPSKQEGLLELLNKVRKYPQDTTFHFHAWTLGYEEVWIALAKELGSQIHVDDYKMGLFTSLRRTHTRQRAARGANPKQEIKTDSFLAPEAAALVGHHFGNDFHSGCLTSDQSVRLHSCEAGTGCSGLNSTDIVWITPILARTSHGLDIPEVGAGGGAGDLTQDHEIDLDEIDEVIKSFQSDVDSGLIKSFGSDMKIEDISRTLRRMRELIKRARSSRPDHTSLADLNVAPVDHDVELPEFFGLLEEAARKGSPIREISKPSASDPKSGPLEDLPRKLQFPYSRHSSYEELCHLVSVFKPKDIYPCTTDEESWCQEDSVRSLFGHLCSADVFSHDVEMEERMTIRQALGLGQRAAEQYSSQPDLHTSSQASEATESSRNDEPVKEKIKKSLAANATMLRRPVASPPSAKRQRTDGESAHSFHTAGSHAANDSYHSTFSVDGRLERMQTSFGGFCAQPSVSPQLTHSVSDPSPLVAGPRSALATPSKGSNEHVRRQTSIQSPLSAKTLRRRSPPTRPTPNANTKAADRDLAGTQARPVELSSGSDSDETTDEEPTPTKPSRKDISGFDGAQESEEDRDTQVTLPDSEFDSQEKDPRQTKAVGSSARVEHRKAAYKAANEKGGLRWEGLISSGSGHGEEELEL